MLERTGTMPSSLWLVRQHRISYYGMVGTVEHLNVGSECVFSKLLTSNDIAMFRVMSPIVTTVIWQTEPNYHFNRFPQSRQILMVKEILLVWVKPTKMDHLERPHNLLSHPSKLFFFRQMDK